MSEPLWTHEEAAAAAAASSTAPWTATGVSIDSRTIAGGDLFVALKGPNFDGHAFVAEALERGAAAAMVSRIPQNLPPELISRDSPLVIVGDTMEGLNRLAIAARARTAARVAAVTGSVGKTGIKEALRLALESQGPTVASRGNLNNKWGVPLSLARMPRGARYGIFELAMNRPGELAPLSQLTRPDVSIITNIEPVHIEFFTSIADIAEAKAEIFRGMEDGIAILHRESPFFHILAEAAREQGVSRIIGFGAHPEAEARLVDCVLEPESSSVSAVIEGRSIHFHLGMPGRHWVVNSLAVLAGATAVGGNLSDAAAALSALEPIEGRGRHHHISLPGGSFDLYDESYNASPVSVRAAISVLARTRPAPGGRRIAVLGDMLELGVASLRMHESLAGDVEESGIDLVFTAGPQMEFLRQALPPEIRGGHAATAADLAPLVKAVVGPGDVVTVKGSYSSRMRDVVEALKNMPQGAADGA